LQKYWQGLIGDEPPKILAKIFAEKTGRVSSVMSFKLTGSDCGWDDQAMAVHIQCNCRRLFHLWKWFGLEGGEWSSAKGLVAPYCNLFSASILFLELPIEVFSSFGTARIIYWPLYFCNKSLWFCSHVAKIQLKVRRANLFSKGQKRAEAKRVGKPILSILRISWLGNFVVKRRKY